MYVKLIRTTLRLRADLKKAAEKLAVDHDLTLQEVFNQALEKYIKKAGKKDSGEIIFLSQDLGVPLDNLTREDYYDDPDPKYFK